MELITFQQWITDVGKYLFIEQPEVGVAVAALISSLTIAVTQNSIALSERRYEVFDEMSRIVDFGRYLQGLHKAKKHEPAQELLVSAMIKMGWTSCMQYNENNRRQVVREKAEEQCYSRGLIVRRAYALFPFISRLSVEDFLDKFGNCLDKLYFANSDRLKEIDDFRECCGSLRVRWMLGVMALHLKSCESLLVRLLLLVMEILRPLFWLVAFFEWLPNGCERAVEWMRNHPRRFLEKIKPKPKELKIKQQAVVVVMEPEIKEPEELTVDAFM